MPRRHEPLPSIWLMTDERAAEAPDRIAARLPKGAGIVFRHHATPPAERRALFERVLRVARARRQMLVLAGPVRDAIGWRADGVHGNHALRRSVRPLLRTMAAHDAREACSARGADAVFISPVFATCSHPGARTLGRRAFTALAVRYTPGCTPAQAGAQLQPARNWAPACAGVQKKGKRKCPPGPHVIALGRMNAARARTLRGAYGWAGIDAWSGDQKRNVVPR